MTESSEGFLIECSSPEWLWNLKPGDLVERCMGNPTVSWTLKVTEVSPELVWCGDWTFDRQTGAEIDEELGWGPAGTGSWIRPLSH